MNIHELILRYERGADQLPIAILGLTREQFRAVPVPNTWSIGQITLHLMDADLIASDRMKRIIAEDNPAIIGYNETAFAARLSGQRDIDVEKAKALLDPELAAESYYMAEDRRRDGQIVRP